MVYVDTQLCKGCGLCIMNCPKNVFEFSSQANNKGYNYIHAVKVDDCIACGICQKICPDFALYVEE